MLKGASISFGSGGGEGRRRRRGGGGGYVVENLHKKFGAVWCRAVSCSVGLKSGMENRLK